MMRFFKSMQVRLYVIFALITILFAVMFVLNLQTFDSMERAHDILDVAGLQRSNAYLLASLARRLVAFNEDEAAQASITDLIEETIANSEQVERSLRYGDEALEVYPVEQPELLPILDNLDREWIEYRGLLETFISADSSEQPELIEGIETQSTVVFAYAESLLEGLDTLQDQMFQANRQLSIITVTGGALVLLISTYVIIQSVNAIRQLHATAQQFAYGNFEMRADTNTVNEIAVVGEVFNGMADNLNMIIGELQVSVTEAREAQQKAERSDQVKSAFLASMSHELRTPLNSIINFTKFVAKGTVGEVNEEQQNLLNEVIDSAKHLLGLINDVLDMSKIESGSLKLFVEDNVNLNTILKSVVSNGKTLIGDKPITLESEIAPDLPPMRGDRQRILQILLNIMSNAAKFTEEGTIKISAQPKGDEIQIAIQDTGPGIAAGDFDGVFQPFKQTTTGLREGGGTGLGMPISKNLVEAHFGRLWLESTPGKGTTFFVALPVRSENLTPVNLTNEVVKV